MPLNFLFTSWSNPGNLNPLSDGRAGRANVDTAFASLANRITGRKPRKLASTASPGGQR